MARTPFGKSRTIENPYAKYEGYGPFGWTELKVLKTYQHPEKEKTNPYARWMVAVKSDFTFGSYDMGDSYIQEAILGLTLKDCTEEWKEYYGG
jgi:hypothetical protein